MKQSTDPVDPKTQRYFIQGQACDAPPLQAGLYLVSTPIGNLGDITLRGLETLAASSVIACEDTRTSGKLLARYGISTDKTSYNEHNATQKGPGLIRQIQAGNAVSLISDAGTPLVSDPGFRLVESAHQAGVNVIPIPGASAPLAALVASGLPAERFLFEGFLPQKSGQRKKKLLAGKDISATLIYFESPNRLEASLKDMAEIFGPERQAVICRELTKMHESLYRGPLGDLAANAKQTIPAKGEIVVLIAPAVAVPVSLEDADPLLLDCLATMPTRKAAATVSAQTGLSKTLLYNRALLLKDDNER